MPQLAHNHPEIVFLANELDNLTSKMPTEKEIFDFKQTLDETTYYLQTLEYPYSGEEIAQAYNNHLLTNLDLNPLYSESANDIMKWANRAWLKLIVLDLAWRLTNNESRNVHEIHFRKNQRYIFSALDFNAKRLEKSGDYSTSFQIYSAIVNMPTILDTQELIFQRAHHYHALSLDCKHIKNQ